MFPTEMHADFFKLLFSNSTPGNINRTIYSEVVHVLTVSEDCARCCCELFTATSWPLAFFSTHVVTGVAMNCTLNGVTSSNDLCLTVIKR